MGEKPVPVLYLIDALVVCPGQLQKVGLVRPEPHHILQIGGTCNNHVTISRAA